MRNKNSVAHIQDCLLGSGSRFESQKETLDDLLADGVPVSNKTIIMQIMRKITDEKDGVRQNTLRVLLELVVGYTPDDPGI